MSPSSPGLAFGAFELDRANRELRCGGERVELGSRYFDALALLVETPGRLITKDRFMAEVWRGIPVTDEALTQCIRTLRRALDDEAAAPRFIETVPKHGYRFIAEVTPGSTAPAAAPSPTARGYVAGAAALGGGAAGAAAGLLYGAVAATGGGATMPVLAALGAALGVLGGAGIGFGLALARLLRPGSAAAELGGGVAGGAVIGAMGQLLSRDGVAVLTGAALGPVAGLFEVALLGLAVSGALLQRRAGAGRLAVSAGLGALAGAAAALAGGRLFGASLFELQTHLPGSGLALERIGALVGERGFGPHALFLTAAGEGALFVAAIAAAEAMSARRI